MTETTGEDLMLHLHIWASYQSGALTRYIALRNNDSFLTIRASSGRQRGVDQGFPKVETDRRMEAQGFADDVLQEAHLVEILQTRLAIISDTAELGPFLCALEKVSHLEAISVRNLCTTSGCRAR